MNPVLQLSLVLQPPLGYSKTFFLRNAWRMYPNQSSPLSVFIRTQQLTQLLGVVGCCSSNRMGSSYHAFSFISHLSEFPAPIFFNVPSTQDYLRRCKKLLITDTFVQVSGITSLQELDALILKYIF